MIKRQNRKYIIGASICVFLEVTLMLAAYAINFYTKTRLGMLRHMVYLNGKWQAQYPIEKIKYLLVALLVILLIGLLFSLIRNKTKSMLLHWSAIVSLLFSTWTLYFLLFNSTDTYKAYYALSVCFVLITILQGCSGYCLIKFNRK